MAVTNYITLEKIGVHSRKEVKKYEAKRDRNIPSSINRERCKDRDRRGR